MISDTPISRRNRSIDVQPAAKKEKLEFEEPFVEKKQGENATSETDISETGAETWLEASRKSSLEVKKEVFGEIPEESAPEPEAPKNTPVAEAKPDAKTATSKPEVKTDDSATYKPASDVEPHSKSKKKTPSNRTRKKAAKSELKPKPLDEKDKVITNPIALAAAEASEKNKAVLELEASQLENAPKDDGSELGAAAQPKETLAEGSMRALLGGLSTDVDVAMSAEKVEVASEKTEQRKVNADSTRPLTPTKMPADYAPPSKKDHSSKDRPIRCFKCNHRQMVSLAASSTQCGRCSVYISLSDYDIKSSQSQAIRTRGDVTIHRRGSLVGCYVACHDLTVLGKISGSVDCSGNATFKNSGKVLGSMHCKHLHVDKKCELTFPQGVVAESADIQGIVNGDITCSGTIKILKTGAVNGDATAKAIVMKDGGSLSGRMSIQHDVDIELPIKRGYDPTIIS